MEVDPHRIDLLNKVTRKHGTSQPPAESRIKTKPYFLPPIRLSSSKYTVRWSLWHCVSFSRSNSSNSSRICSLSATWMDHRHILWKKIKCKNKLLWKFPMLSLVCKYLRCFRCDSLIVVVALTWVSWISDDASLSKYNSIRYTAQGPVCTYVEFYRQVVII